MDSSATPASVTDPVVPSRGLRIARTLTLAGAVLCPLAGCFSFGLFLLAMPVGFVLVLTGVVLDAVIAARTPEARLFPFGPAWISPLATLFLGGTAHVGALYGAGLIGSLLGNGFSRGRQLRERGVTKLPPVLPGAAWTVGGNSGRGARARRDVGRVDAAALEAIPVAVRGPLAARFRENGRTEHASVGAFARLSLDLMTLGAPPTLLADASRDALDEIYHAELCFGLARALDGTPQSPGPLTAPTSELVGRPRHEALATLAVDSLFDGALHEGLSARVLAVLAKRCEVPAIATILATLAADEGRHAAHAWDVLDYCVAEGGPFVEAAVDAAVRNLPETFTSDLPEEARSGAWERWGIHGAALETEMYAATIAALRARVRKPVHE